MRSIAALLAVSLVTLGGAVAHAQAGALSAQEAWIRAVPGSDVAAAYLTLHNAGTQPVVVVGVRSPAAGMAMIHETALVNGKSTMRPHERLRVGCRRDGAARSRRTAHHAADAEPHPGARG